MPKNLKEEVEEWLRTVETDGDLAPRSAGILAARCAEFEMTAASNEIDGEHFHERVRRTLDQLNAEQELDRRIAGALRRLLNNHHQTEFEEDMQLTGHFEYIGALLFYQVDVEEARRAELTDAFDEFLKNRRRRGQFKEAFLQSYRKEMSRVGALPFVSTAIEMMNLEHLVADN